MDVQIIQSKPHKKTLILQKIEQNAPQNKNEFSNPREMTLEYRNECLLMLSKIEKLQLRLSKLQRINKNLQNASVNRPKKHRRRNSELQKQYKCVVENCNKKYGSITSLKLHLRAKHGIRAKKQRLRQQIITLTE